MLGSVLLVAAMLLTALTLLRWLDSYGSALWPVLQSMRWLYALAAVLVLLVAALARRWSAALLAAALVAVHLVVAVPSFVPAAAVAAGSDDLVVLSANLQYGQAEPAAVVQAVRSHQVDVLVLLEATAAAERGLSQAGLDELLPESVGRTREDAGGTLVRSHLPLVPQLDGRTTSFDQPTVLVLAPAGEVLLRAAHPLPPLHAPTWHGELTELTGWAAGTSRDHEGPVVLAGDLNATEDHPVFRRLTQVLADAHRERGAGWVRTWPVNRSFPPPFCQIDHVLVRGLGVVDAGTAHIRGTDHAAVWARLSFG